MSDSKQITVIDKDGRRGIVDVTARPPFDGSGTQILVSIDNDARRVAVPIRALVDRKEQGYFLPLGFAELPTPTDLANSQDGGTIATPATNETLKARQHGADEATVAATDAAQRAYERDETLSQLRPIKHDNGKPERRDWESDWQDDATIEMALPLSAHTFSSRISQENARQQPDASAFVRPPLVIDTGIDASAKHDKPAAFYHRPQSSVLIYACLAVALAFGVLGGILLSRLGAPPDATDSPDVSVQQSSTAAPRQSVAPTGTGAGASLPNFSGGGGAEIARDIEVRGKAGRGRSARENPQSVELRAALDGWVAAIQTHDLDRQLNFYAPTVQAYYLSSNVSLDAVREDKARRAETSALIAINVSEPEITFNSNRTATMLFRLEYVRADGSNQRRNDIWYELKWLKTANSWKIISERDVSASR
ncbi:MAG: hypothetical protein ABR577_16520 [Pyrinomonadaceae bacterium]